MHLHPNAARQWRSADQIVTCGMHQFGGSCSKRDGPLMKSGHECTCCAQSRRASLASLVGAAAVLSGAAPALAAYGDSANVFGKATNTTGFISYAGEGFAIQLPSKWNPSKEQDYPGTLLRYRTRTCTDD